MNKEEAVKVIEAEFDSMTSKQRKVLWKTLFELSEDSFKHGRNFGKLPESERPFVLIRFENEIKSHTIVGLAIKYGIPIDIAQTYAGYLIKSEFKKNYWEQQANDWLANNSNISPENFAEFNKEMGEWAYIRQKVE